MHRHRCIYGAQPEQMGRGHFVARALPGSQIVMTRLADDKEVTRLVREQLGL